MTQSDKDFITRIQVSQLVTQDPFSDDFYAQVFGRLLHSRLGVNAPEAVLKFGSGGGVGLGLSQVKGGRRQSAMQRMEQQVERIVNNARLREKEKTSTFLPRDLLFATGAYLPYSPQQSPGSPWEDSWSEL